jgi:hypothetical protein
MMACAEVESGRRAPKTGAGRAGSITARESAQVMITFVSSAAVALLSAGMFIEGLRTLGHQWLHKKTDGYLQGRHAAAVAMCLGGITSFLLFGGLALSQLGLVKIATSTSLRSRSLAGASAAFVVVACVLGYQYTVYSLLHVSEFWQQGFDVL